MLQLREMDLEREPVDTLVVFVCKDRTVYSESVPLALTEKALGFREFRGEKEEKITFYGHEGTGIQRAILVGIGEFQSLDAEGLRSATGRVVRGCIKKKIPSVIIAVPSASLLGMDPALVTEAVAEGAFLGNHLFLRYKNEKQLAVLTEITLHLQEAGRLDGLLSRVETVCEGTLLAREWVTTPSNDKLPEEFARSTASLAERHGLKTRVMEEKELLRRGFGGITAVASGSRNPPRLLILEYRPRRPDTSVVLVGKGVTFDSGGINLKPTASLEDMKMDMSGAAAVAATAITMGRLRPGLRVVGVIPLVENMPSGSAVRPGDVIRCYGGKTVEVLNTDAEGRLILADAMAYAAEKFRPDTMIDLATLTGACVVALGEKIAGVFSPDRELAWEILESGEKTFERCWSMPMPKDYKDLIKSELADIKNVSESRWGGAIVAALFLAEFAAGTRWAHIDIAGPAYAKKEGAYCGPGGTGFGVRLLCELMKTW